MKKMLENKTRKMIVALVAVFIVATAMTGIASAAVKVTGIVYDSDGVIVIGADVDVYSDSDHTVKIGYGLTDSFGWYTVYTAALSEGQTAYVTASKDGNSGANDGEVEQHGEGMFTADIAVVIVTFSVPEFATIAIPVAAILGLLFFFNHRKRKKE